MIGKAETRLKELTRLTISLVLRDICNKIPVHNAVLALESGKLTIAVDDISPLDSRSPAAPASECQAPR